MGGMRPDARNKRGHESDSTEDEDDLAKFREAAVAVTPLPTHPSDKLFGPLGISFSHSGTYSVMLAFTLARFRPRGPFFIQSAIRYLNSHIPLKPVECVHKQARSGPVIHVSPKLVAHLERLSLVDFSNEEGVRRLEEAIRFAQPLQQVDTTGIEPMTSVLEEETLRLRADIEQQDNSKADILANAKEVEEDFFVAPPGNIPLEVTENKYDNAVDKLLQGHWLKRAQTQGTFTLGVNGHQLQENLMARYKASLETFVSLDDHHCPCEDNVITLNDTTIRVESPVVRSCQVNFQRDNPDKWKWRYNDFLRVRRRFWKNFLVDPASVQVREESPTSDAPKASISCNFEGLNLGLSSLASSTEPLERMDLIEPDKLALSTNLDMATLTLLLDSVRTRQFIPSTRIALHTQLAPFQTAFVVQNPSADLVDLQELLTILAQEKGIRVFNEASNDHLADLFGIPYQVVLTENSLSTGVVLLRDSVTCWYEEIHVAHVVRRLVQIYQERDCPDSWSEMKQDYFPDRAFVLKSK
eukprot:TCALIF_10247-PA protein Name:"Similar to BRAFLDRAFT_270748 Glutamyl-tRNA(Gln) amidotransferase subunit C, mitochondrial (Branchiostoma floridae)" AED:0.06 eAED:0.06 QI:0/0.25/0.2/0.6/0.5/0.4/5/13/525